MIACTSGTAAYTSITVCIKSTARHANKHVRREQIGDRLNHAEAAATENASCGCEYGYGFKALHRLGMLRHLVTASDNDPIDL